jgi:hypothetical protein
MSGPLARSRPRPGPFQRRRGHFHEHRRPPERTPRTARTAVGDGWRNGLSTGCARSCTSLIRRRVTVASCTRSGEVVESEGAHGDGGRDGGAVCDATVQPPGSGARATDPAVHAVVVAGRPHPRGLRPGPARRGVDADTIGRAKVLLQVRGDVTYPGDPGGRWRDGRDRPACVITSTALKDREWITEVTRHGWVISPATSASRNARQRSPSHGLWREAVHDLQSATSALRVRDPTSLRVDGCCSSAQHAER